MADQPYTPNLAYVRESYIHGAAAWEHESIKAADFDRFIAKVKRDAAREALDGLANESVGAHNAPPYLTPQIPRSFVEFASLVTWYRDTHYPTPEETP